MHEFWGQQTLCNMSELHIIDLNDTYSLTNLLKESIEEAKASLVEVVCHEFSPEGATIIAILKESHVAIHTYPEHNALFFDAFTCGKAAAPEKMARFLIDHLKPGRYTLKNLIRSADAIKEKSS